MKPFNYVDSPFTSERHGINLQLIRRFYISFSGNFKRTIKADHILEIAGLELFCDYRFNRSCL